MKEPIESQCIAPATSKVMSKVVDIHPFDLQWILNATAEEAPDRIASFLCQRVMTTPYHAVKAGVDEKSVSAGMIEYIKIAGQLYRQTLSATLVSDYAKAKWTEYLALRG